MQRSFSFQFNVVTFQNLYFDENGLNKMVAKKKSWRGENKTIHLWWVYGYMGGGVVVKFQYITYILIISCNITSC